MMKRKRQLIALVPLFVSCGTKIERQAIETKDFVEGVIPISLAEVSTQIRNGALGEKSVNGSTLRLAGKPAEYPFMEYKAFSVGNVGSFPTDNLRDNSKDDPAMDRYLRLSPEARRHDIFLGNITVGSYWYSEYNENGKPLPFYCDFIIHLQEDGPGRTRVEVLEYNPQVKLGNVLGRGHGGVIGFVSNEKLVPPTTRDRVEMLERIQTLSRAN